MTRKPKKAEPDIRLVYVTEQTQRMVERAHRTIHGTAWVCLDFLCRYLGGTLEIQGGALTLTANTPETPKPTKPPKRTRKKR